MQPREQSDAADKSPQAPPTREQLASLIRAGRLLQDQGYVAEALAVFQQAAVSWPDSAELINNMGNCQQMTGRQDLARKCYEQAIAADDKFIPAHQNLGYLLVNFGLLDEGLRYLRRAQEIQPKPINRVMLATSLPVIYESVDDVRVRRAALEANVQQLLDDGVSIDATRTPVPTNFFAAYQGCNDRELQEKLCRVYQVPQPVLRQSRADRGDRIRVGFLSAYFCNHTIGRLNLGRISQLDRSRFEVTLISCGRHSDEAANTFRQAADHHITLSGRLDQARQQVASLPLDILMFPDVGMNTQTYTLALSRMAPVQCVGWGHPVTTGSPAIDYFVSSRLLETDEAGAHYSEQLIRLENLGTYYYRPRLMQPVRTREFFGFDDKQHVYLCPQTLFKMHPDFDPLLAEILRRDPQGVLVLLEGRQREWTRLLRERFERTMPDVAARVRFLPGQSNADFLHLNAVADVSLDPLHFGGGNSSYEALAVGTPIVTLPGPYLRSRITLAMYRKMGLMDCVVSTPEAYVELALRLGTDREQRAAISAKILAANDALFADMAEVREFERFLAGAVESGRDWTVQQYASK